ncbi:hypothetical protein HBI56_132070 [Parastagonospora nodorum]|uniref:BHLH domain-containing protein n=2 Tax=Phaeosphaeria nodorum (strain SN15 / ATCC MYA-4574 / FGSC 10173) TaxID=321614 RepID=A0A7U2F0B0_PHANO|nr:hypothetical protein SNOG_05778 [Parastagonospora nodorum SN15]KAH3909751.1 hypothetical protein HBH56_151760 [Parastagonospora nodorum]EAT86842.1 hypothetical protein SNOG_05778 [Parastagonospora nodorum SN15]KAH3926842.1 hypothetical protein HBH54_165940 [Parastagonospora nodorum]KAH3940402.1 hypothetical protein HBH53_218910 [Parastagonospora nodorum]KAH3970202.1 hypothetical protein HBH52_164910 [Parastagonospora nodorum]
MSHYPICLLPEDISYQWFRTSAIIDGPQPNMNRATPNVMTNTSMQGWNVFDATPLGETGVIQSHGAFAATQFPRAGASQTSSPLATGYESSEFDCSLQTSPLGLSPISTSSREHSYSSPDTRHNLSDKSSTHRKLGRPRTSRTPFMSPSPHRTPCLPHKQVERKYREGLNMSFERLRRAVPTLPRSVNSDVMGSAKPSKGMVLAAAIEYIGKVERERDAALSNLAKRKENMRVMNT